ncbi:MAG: nuclear transport factor 2 family protein [Thermoleophilia bacterium]|nr:nuclear transport factor 2 family protein [Thermoleophilia bacterium]
MKLRLILIAALAALLIVPATGSAAGGKSIDRLVDAHIEALADCDADALVAGYTNDATLFFPDGVIVQGRAALQDLYDGFVKPPEQKGLCGLDAKPQKSWTSGRTTFVKFKVTAPFLAKPYFSTDGYVFKGNKIAAEVSTFDSSKLTFKP